MTETSLLTKDASRSNILPLEWGGVAQMAEQGTHKPRVAGSSPAPATVFEQARRHRACFVIHLDAP